MARAAAGPRVPRESSSTPPSPSPSSATRRASSEGPRGELTNFTGIDSPYELPRAPELTSTRRRFLPSRRPKSSSSCSTMAAISRWGPTRPSRPLHKICYSLTQISKVGGILRMAKIIGIDLGTDQLVRGRHGGRRADGHRERRGRPHHAVGRRLRPPASGSSAPSPSARRSPTPRTPSTRSSASWAAGTTKCTEERSWCPTRSSAATNGDVGRDRRQEDTRRRRSRP